MDNFTFDQDLALIILTSEVKEWMKFSVPENSVVDSEILIAGYPSDKGQIRRMWY